MPAWAAVQGGAGMMSREQARILAEHVAAALPASERKRLKAIHVVTRLHSGMLTIRCHFVSQTAEDPEPYVFPVSELR
ncbi:MAG TPA: hypothetical protein VL563_01135 [Gemmatimonadales bacterium]|nr:hypothetical protein [Gemmatimonadales bacterium]